MYGDVSQRKCVFSVKVITHNGSRKSSCVDYNIDEVQLIITEKPTICICSTIYSLNYVIHSIPLSYYIKQEMQSYCQWQSTHDFFVFLRNEVHSRWKADCSNRYWRFSSPFQEPHLTEYKKSTVSIWSARFVWTTWILQSVVSHQTRCKVFINSPVMVLPGGVNHNAFIIMVCLGGLIITINALWLPPPCCG